MKYFLLLLFFSLFACGSAQVEQKPLYKTNATVQNIFGEVAILQPNDFSISYTVPADSLELNMEYVFWLDITDCHKCKNIKAIVIKKAYTTYQAQRDQAKISKELSNRVIIKKWSAYLCPPNDSRKFYFLLIRNLDKRNF